MMEVGFITGIPPVVGREKVGVCRSARVVSPVGQRRNRTVVCAMESQELGKTLRVSESQAAPVRRRKRDIVAALVAALVLAPAAAIAARSGGRMGGSSFRAPRPSQSFSRSMGTPRTETHHHHHHHHGGGMLGGGMFSLFNPYRKTSPLSSSRAFITHCFVLDLLPRS